MGICKGEGSFFYFLTYGIFHKDASGKKANHPSNYPRLRIIKVLAVEEFAICRLDVMRPCESHIEWPRDSTTNGRLMWKKKIFNYIKKRRRRRRRRRARRGEEGLAKKRKFFFLYFCTCTYGFPPKKITT